MIDFHRRMLADTVRNQAFAEALQRSVEPGKTTVSDIGSGTGLLAFLASKLGAKECHCYETGDVIEISKALAKENDITNCTFIRKHSTQVKTPVKTDVVVAEVLGNYALEEHIIETLADAKRFLKPGGTLIPRSLEQFVVPVTSDTFLKELSVWDDVDSHLSFDAAKEVTLNNVYVRTFKQEDLYQGEGAVKMWDKIFFGEDGDSIRTATVHWDITSPVAINGFCLYWECELLPGLQLVTNPSNPPTHWEQIFLPIPQTISLKKGDRLKLHLKSDTRMSVGVDVQWEVDAPEVKWKGDMRRGFLE